jgi:hypothetical protein
LDAPPTRALTDLGAPLKLSAYAVCHLTAHASALPALNALLDHALLAAVLHDHVMDWESDLRAGRWNFFVAAVSPFAQNRIHERANHARVMEAWMTHDTPRAYFDEIEFHIRRAAQASRALRVSPLRAHFEWFAAEVKELYSLRRQMYQTQLEKAAARLFGSMYLAAP